MNDHGHGNGHGHGHELCRARARAGHGHGLGTGMGWARDGVLGCGGVNILVTGGTGGIGRELVRALAETGADVIVGARDQARAGAALAGLGAKVRARVRVQPLDLASVASVRALVAWAGSEVRQLDALVNAAAVWPRQRRTSVDGFDLTFAVNHVAHHALTVGLLPALRRARAGRVVTVSSGLHARGRLAWDDLMQTAGGYNGTRAYEQSKLANVMFALALARRAGRSITSNAIHPGVVRTELTRDYPEIFRDTPARSLSTARAAAGCIARLVLDASVARTTGAYFDRDRAVAPSKQASVVADQDRLWQVTDDLLARVGT